MFLGAHSLRIFADSWRSAQIARIGENPWKGLYSLVSIAGFVLLIWGYGRARAATIVLWQPPSWTHYLAALFVLIAFVLVVAAYVRGTRIKSALHHPMLLGVKSWAFGHLIANGTLADVVLFGSFLVWAIVDFAASRRRDRVAGTVSPCGQRQRVTRSPSRSASPPGRYSPSICTNAGSGCGRSADLSMDFSGDHRCDRCGAAGCAARRRMCGREPISHAASAGRRTCCADRACHARCARRQPNRRRTDGLASTTPPSQVAASAARAANHPAAKPAAPEAKAPAKPAAAAAPPPAKAAPAPVAKAAPPPLDLKALETELKETKAIGVMTKLSIKNQVDDSAEPVPRAFYQGKLKTTLAELRRPFDLLVLKLLSLLQDSDPTLAAAIVRVTRGDLGHSSDRTKIRITR